MLSDVQRGLVYLLDREHHEVLAVNSEDLSLTRTASLGSAVSDFAIAVDQDRLIALYPEESVIRYFTSGN
jgi:hypothetical protein